MLGFQGRNERGYGNYRPKSTIPDEAPATQPGSSKGMAEAKLWSISSISKGATGNGKG